MIIRKIEERDWISISHLEKKRFLDDCFSRYFLRMMPLLHGRFSFVAEVEGELVGYISGEVEGENVEKAWILSIVVDSDFEGRGIGLALLDRCIEEMRLKSISSISLTVSPENERAIGLYEKCGFVNKDLKQDFYGEGHHRFLFVLGL